jgi:predicted RNA binding protein YcfA (HicA-like mRNA interferase family)
MNGYYELVIEQLSKFGFSLVRSGKGSHEVWSNGGRPVIVSKNCYSRHTANSIMKDAGIKYKF